MACYPRALCLVKGFFVLPVLMLTPACNERSANHSHVVETVADPDGFEITLAELEGAKEFRLLWGKGATLDPFNVLTISGTGDCTYVFAVYRDARNTAKLEHAYRRTRFQVDARTMKDLFGLLLRVRYFQLARRYRARDVWDGSQVYLSVRVDEKEKRVVCDNYFPSSVTALTHFLEKEIVGAHPDEINAAPVISTDAYDKVLLELTLAIEPDLP